MSTWTTDISKKQTIKTHRHNKRRMANKVELLFLSALFLAPCAMILVPAAQSPSLFALHPAANALAFLVCFPACVGCIASVLSDSSSLVEWSFGWCLGLIVCCVAWIGRCMRCSCATRLRISRPGSYSLFPARIWIRYDSEFALTLACMAANCCSVTLVKLHMWLQILALLLMSGAGAAAYLAKEANAKPHFVSTHSWIAGATSTLFTLNMLGVHCPVH